MGKFKSAFNFSLTKTKYFWIAIIAIGTIGIWLPFILGNKLKLSEIPILFTTYYVSIYFSGCLDSVIQKIQSLGKHDQKEEVVKHFLNVVALIICALALVLATILFNKNGFHYTALFFALLGTFISLSLWWDNNHEGKTFDQELRQEASDNHGNSW